jgi:hypothetical protein
VSPSDEIFAHHRTSSNTNPTVDKPLNIGCATAVAFSAARQLFLTPCKAPGCALAMQAVGMAALGVARKTKNVI